MKTRRNQPAAPRGFASVIVLILIFVMIALLLGNNRVLHWLKRDLQRIEERQVARSTERVKPVATVPVSASPEPGASAPNGQHEAAPP